MDQHEFSPLRKEAFLKLMDDPSPVVRQALLEKFKAGGSAGERFLTSVLNGERRELAPHATWFIKTLQFDNPQADFHDFIRSLNYELETGALLLSRTVDPGLDIGRCCGLLDEIADRCLEIIMPPMSPRDQCRALNRVLFHEYGFRGHTDDCNDPRSNLLSEVLRRRRGEPLTLSMLYILVAQRCGLTLDPVEIPGRFLVGCFLRKIPFFVDPFENGAFRTPAQILEYLHNNHVTPKMAYLAPMPVREVLTRNCGNLADCYRSLDQPKPAHLFTTFVDEFEATYRRHAQP